MIGVYRSACKVPADTVITIACDGENLENETVKELDLDDGDVLDVQFRTGGK